RAKDGKAGFGELLAGGCLGGVGARSPEHHFATTDRLREEIVVTRQMDQALDRVLVEIAEMFDSFARRGTIRFRENDVERNRRDLHVVETIEQIRQDGPRPGPLS